MDNGYHGIIFWFIGNITFALLTYTGWEMQYSDYCYLAAYFISLFQFAFFYIRPIDILNFKLHNAS
jgi:hypothetical protein